MPKSNTSNPLSISLAQYQSPYQSKSSDDYFKMVQAMQAAQARAAGGGGGGGGGRRAALTPEEKLAQQLDKERRTEERQIAREERAEARRLAAEERRAALAEERERQKHISKYYDPVTRQYVDIEGRDAKERDANFKRYQQGQANDILLNDPEFQQQVEDYRSAASVRSRGKAVDAMRNSVSRLSTERGIDPKLMTSGVFGDIVREQNAAQKAIDDTSLASIFGDTLKMSGSRMWNSILDAYDTVTGDENSIVARAKTQKEEADNVTNSNAFLKERAARTAEGESVFSRFSPGEFAAILGENPVDLATTLAGAGVGGALFRGGSALVGRVARLVGGGAKAARAGKAGEFVAEAEEVRKAAQAAGDAAAAATVSKEIDEAQKIAKALGGRTVTTGERVARAAGAGTAMSGTFVNAEAQRLLAEENMTDEERAAALARTGPAALGMGFASGALIEPMAQPLAGAIGRGLANRGINSRLGWNAFRAAAVKDAAAAGTKATVEALELAGARDAQAALQANLLRRYLGSALPAAAVESTALGTGMTIGGNAIHNAATGQTNSLVEGLGENLAEGLMASPLYAGFMLPARRPLTFDQARLLARDTANTKTNADLEKSGKSGMSTVDREKTITGAIEGSEEEEDKSKKPAPKKKGGTTPPKNTKKKPASTPATPAADADANAGAGPNGAENYVLTPDIVARDRARVDTMTAPELLRLENRYRKTLADNADKYDDSQKKAIQDNIALFRDTHLGSGHSPDDATKDIITRNNPQEIQKAITATTDAIAKLQPQVASGGRDVQLQIDALRSNLNALRDAGILLGRGGKGAPQRSAYAAHLDREVLAAVRSGDKEQMRKLRATYEADLARMRAELKRLSDKNENPSRQWELQTEIKEHEDAIKTLDGVISGTGAEPKAAEEPETPATEEKPAEGEAPAEEPKAKEEPETPAEEPKTKEEPETPAEEPKAKEKETTTKPKSTADSGSGETITEEKSKAGVTAEPKPETYAMSSGKTIAVGDNVPIPDILQNFENVTHGHQDFLNRMLARAQREVAAATDDASRQKAWENLHRIQAMQHVYAMNKSRSDIKEAARRMIKEWASMSPEEKEANALFMYHVLKNTRTGDFRKGDFGTKTVAVESDVTKLVTGGDAPIEGGQNAESAKVGDAGQAESEPADAVGAEEGGDRAEDTVGDADQSAAENPDEAPANGAGDEESGTAGPARTDTGEDTNAPRNDGSEESASEAAVGESGAEPAAGGDAESGEGTGGVEPAAGEGTGDGRSQAAVERAARLEEFKRDHPLPPDPNSMEHDQMQLAYTLVDGGMDFEQALHNSAYFGTLAKAIAARTGADAQTVFRSMHVTFSDTPAPGTRTDGQAIAADANAAAEKNGPSPEDPYLFTFNQVQDVRDWLNKRLDWFLKNRVDPGEVIDDAKRAEAQRFLQSSLGDLIMMTNTENPDMDGLIARFLAANMHGAGTEKSKSAPHGARTGGVFRANGDKLYIISIDISTLCAKRHGTAATARMLEKALGHPLDEDGQMLIIAMRQSEGLQAPCTYCYVEAPRRAAKQAVADSIAVMKGTFDPERLKAWKPERRAIADAARAELASQKAKDRNLTADNLPFYYVTDPYHKNTPEAAKFKEDFPAVVKFMETENGSHKANAERLYEQYGGELLDMSQEFYDFINNEAGLRFFSSSDFQIEQVVDIAQIFHDCELVNLNTHAYTKVEDYVRIFGNTGQKINMSCMTRGVDRNGSTNVHDWIVKQDTAQGWNHQKAFYYRSIMPDVGTVLVGVSDDAIFYAIHHDGYDYIIPFHSSGMGNALVDALGYQNFSSTQNETLIDHPGATAARSWTDEKGVVHVCKKNESIPEGYRDMKISMGDLRTHEGISNEEGTRRYLTECMNRRLYPVFLQFMFRDYFPVDPRDPALAKKKAKQIQDAKARWKEMVDKGEIDWSQIEFNHFKLKKDYGRTDTPFTATKGSRIDTNIMRECLNKLYADAQKHDGTMKYLTEGDQNIADRAAVAYRTARENGWTPGQIAEACGTCTKNFWDPYEYIVNGKEVVSTKYLDYGRNDNVGSNGRQLVRYDASGNQLAGKVTIDDRDYTIAMPEEDGTRAVAYLVDKGQFRTPSFDGNPTYWGVNLTEAKSRDAQMFDPLDNRVELYLESDKGKITPVSNPELTNAINAKPTLQGLLLEKMDKLVPVRDTIATAVASAQKEIRKHNNNVRTWSRWANTYDTSASTAVKRLAKALEDRANYHSTTPGVSMEEVGGLRTMASLLRDHWATHNRLPDRAEFASFVRRALDADRRILQPDFDLVAGAAKLSLDGDLRPRRATGTLLEAKMPPSGRVLAADAPLDRQPPHVRDALGRLPDDTRAMLGLEDAETTKAARADFDIRLKDASDDVRNLSAEADDLVRQLGGDVDKLDRSALDSRKRALFDRLVDVNQRLSDSADLLARLKVIDERGFGKTKLTGENVYKLLTMETGSNREASMALRDAGIDALSVKDGFVLFDDGAISDIRKFHQQMEQRVRGQMTIDRTKGTAEMTLFRPDYDPSTFAHESTHFMLDTYQNFLENGYDAAVETLKKDIVGIDETRLNDTIKKILNGEKVTLDELEVAIRGATNSANKRPLTPKDWNYPNRNRQPYAMAKMANTLRAMQDIRNDFAKLREWCNLPKEGRLTREQYTAMHEQVARGFEQYLSEGKAPTKGLRAFFAKMKEWLQNLYHSWKEYVGAELTDEVKAIYDRLLGSHVGDGSLGDFQHALYRDTSFGEVELSVKQKDGSFKKEMVPAILIDGNGEQQSYVPLPKEWIKYDGDGGFAADEMRQDIEHRYLMYNLKSLVHGELLPHMFNKGPMEEYRSFLTPLCKRLGVNLRMTTLNAGAVADLRRIQKFRPDTYVRDYISYVLAKEANPYLSYHTIFDNPASPVC